jgi:hypothetical protein
MAAPRTQRAKALKQFAPTIHHAPDERGEDKLHCQLHLPSRTYDRIRSRCARSTPFNLYLTEQAIPAHWRNARKLRAEVLTHFLEDENSDPFAPINGTLVGCRCNCQHVSLQAKKPYLIRPDPAFVGRNIQVMRHLVALHRVRSGVRDF